MKGGPKFFIFIVSILCSLLFIGISIPLILQKIPPNEFYGIRIEKAFESDVLWYQVNQYGGWAMVVAGVILLIASCLLYLFRKKLNTGTYTGIFVAILLVCLFTASGITTWYAGQLN